MHVPVTMYNWQMDGLRRKSSIPKGPSAASVRPRRYHAQLLSALAPRNSLWNHSSMAFSELLKDA